MRVVGWFSVYMYVCVSGRVDGLLGVWMEGWVCGWVIGCVNRWLGV